MKKKLHSQAGFIITDFIFAIILASGLGVLLFSISYSLAVVEVTQYVSFSTARSHLASNKNPTEQAGKARKKYDSLVSSKNAVGSLYQNGWFEVGKSDAVDIRGGQTADGRKFSDDLGGGADSPDRNWFMGVSVPLTIALMKFNFPFLGSTAPDQDDGFPTKLNTMLIRESSEKECKDFMESRRQALGSLPSATTYYDPAAYFPMEDNGC